MVTPSHAALSNNWVECLPSSGFGSVSGYQLLIIHLFHALKSVLRQISLRLQGHPTWHPWPGVQVLVSFNCPSLPLIQWTLPYSLRDNPYHLFSTLCLDTFLSSFHCLKSVLLFSNFRSVSPINTKAKTVHILHLYFSHRVAELWVNKWMN